MSKLLCELSRSPGIGSLTILGTTTNVRLTLDQHVLAQLCLLATLDQAFSDIQDVRWLYAPAKLPGTATLRSQPHGGLMPHRTVWGERRVYDAWFLFQCPRCEWAGEFARVSFMFADHGTPSRVILSKARPLMDHTRLPLMNLTRLSPLCNHKWSPDQHAFLQLALCAASRL